jgi:tryptophan halogenase
VKSVVILGGGTAGWMTAASLANEYQQLGVSITLVESSQIGTIGVGEATVPAIRRYFRSLGLDTFEVLRATGGTVKLAIEFDGWRQAGHRFMHPFGRYGIEAGPVAFADLWNRMRAGGDELPLDELSLCTQLARAHRVYLPPERPRADFESFDWAVHFDAGRFATLLRGYAEARGVRRIDARLEEAPVDPASGDIRELRLDGGRSVAGDLYIDCSGFNRLLISGAVGSGYRDWSHWLPCDRAVALPCAHANAADIAPYTISRAQDAGWTWRIPLQHRVGNGHVYSSSRISDEQALAVLRGQLEGPALADPNLVRFRAGHVEDFWRRNCVAIGLSAGFLEPLESTSISLIQMGIDKLVHLWPMRGIDPVLAAEYNRLSRLEYERVRDFIVLHYAANARQQGELWQYCRGMALPDTLAQRIELYRARGLVTLLEAESFFAPSWLCMYGNFGIEAGGWDPRADRLPAAELATVLQRLRTDIAAMAREGSPHRDFLRVNGALEADQGA